MTDKMTTLWADSDGDDISVVEENTTLSGERMTGKFLVLRQWLPNGERTAAIVSLPEEPADQRKLLVGLKEALAATWDVRGPCVVWGAADGGWMVSGNIADGLTFAEYDRAAEMLEDADYGSINHMISRILTENPGLGFTGLNMDPENSCFFAYPDSAPHARELSEWINSKEWLA